MTLTCYVNGVLRTFDVTPDEYLADTLRRNGFVSVREGCNESACGACTVLLDDKPVLSCSILSAKAEGKHITTVDGIQDEAKKLSHYFAEEGADQCGYCNVGFALTVYSLKKHNKNATDEEIKEYIVGNLCRCAGYQSQLKAIKAYLKGE